MGSHIILYRDEDGGRLEVVRDQLGQIWEFTGWEAAAEFAHRRFGLHALWQLVALDQFDL